MKVTTRLFMVLELLLMATISTEAQKIEVVNAEGHAIPLVSVLTQDGILIGTTNMNGELADVKGHTKVALTHVAYKPQLVTVDQTGSRFTMEDIDYGLAEVVVRPKPYVFKEYYYRAFRYIGDSLRAYSEGIIPAIYDIKNNYKSKTRAIWSYNTKANKAVTWHGVHMLNQVESWVKSASGKMPEIWLKEKDFQERYRASLVADGSNFWRVELPTKEAVGQIVHTNGQSLTTLDGARMQMYSNEVHGETKMLNKRQKRDYAYQYASVFKLPNEADGDIPGLFRHTMTMHHWEYDSDKGRTIDIIYIYSTDNGYTDETQFKARSKELNKDGEGVYMSFESLKAYADRHNIPALDPAQLQAIEALKKTN
jgi:hypothetical protein